MSRICCSRGLVSLLIGAPGTQWVKPEKRETPKRHRNIRNARNEGGREGQGGSERRPRGDEKRGGGREARGETGGQGQKVRRKAKPDVRTTNANCCT